MRVPLRAHWIALLSLGLSFLLEGASFPRPTAAAALPDFDRRPALPADAPAASNRQQLARTALQAEDARLQIKFDPRLGTPRLVTVARGFLGAPDTAAAPGRSPLQLAMPPVPPAAGTGNALAPAADVGPFRALRSFVRQHAELFGHGPELLDQATLRRDDVSSASGLRTVVWEQQLDGIPVFGGLFVGHLTPRGELVRLSSRFLPDLTAAVDRGHANRAAILARPRISAEDALTRVAQNLGEPEGARQTIALDAQPEGPEHRQRFASSVSRGPAFLQWTWVPLSRSVARLAWQVELASRRGGAWYRLLVDAESGEVLVRHCFTYSLSEASYRVFTHDSPSPFSPGLAQPGEQQPPLVERTLVTLSALSTNASPNGWIDDGVNELRGNNVDAHLDRDDDDQPDLPRAQGSPARVFDFPLNLTRAPSTYGAAAVTELFYWNNWIHDRLYELGFTETAGNFQKANFGRGGEANDPIMADAQDGGGFNNANFTAPRDGIPGRIQMYLFDAPTPDRDGTLDTEVILHEYVHGLTSRLVGGGAGITALQSRGLGEGWSDFYALAFLSEAADDLDASYAFGGYTAYRFERLKENYYFGIRRYPYSTDRARNPLTFRDIDPVQAGIHERIPLNPIYAQYNLPEEVHNQGEVWCATLWEARANLVAELGYDAGNTLILQLVTDGLKLTPADPDFLEARDAILQADQVLTGGAHRDALWRAFAKRGMGYGAHAPRSDTTDGVVEAFDVPDDLLVTPVANFVSLGAEAGPFVPTNHVFTLTNDGTNRVVWSALKSAPWFDLSTHSGELAPDAPSLAVMATLNDTAARLPAGLYEDPIIFTNHTTSRTQTRTVELRVGQKDPFTQRLSGMPEALIRHSLTFTPDGSANFYSVCREPALDFGTDPSTSNVLSFEDELSATTPLTEGARVRLYGSSYDRLYVSPSGYVTFSRAVSDFSGSLEGHFSDPRISLLVDAFGFYFGGVVSWVQLPDRVAVTYEGMIDPSTFEPTSMQLEMYFDGRLRLTYLDVAVDSGLLGISRGEGVPERFTDSHLELAGSCQPSLGFQLVASAREGQTDLEGRITLPAPLADDLLVRLVSTAPGEVPVPEQIILPRGAVAATFPLQVTDNAIADGSRAVRLTASAAGFSESSARLEIVDDEQLRFTVTVPPAAREGDGRLHEAGRVEIPSPASRNLVVALSSADSDEVTVPPTAIIPAGEIGATFDLFVQDDARIDGPNSIAISAHVPNWLDGQATIVVADNEVRALQLQVVTQAGENNGRLSSAGTIALSGTLTNDLRVSLASSDPASLAPSATVVIPAGRTNAGFDLTLVDNSAAEGTRVVRITAGAEGFPEAAAVVSVHDDETPPVPADPRPADLATNAPPALALEWNKGTGEQLANGDFETGDFSAWFEQSTGNGGFAVNDGGSDPDGPQGPATPVSGRYEVWTQQSGPGRYVLWQDFTVPPGASSAVLSWDQEIHNHASIFAEGSQEFRVEIRTPDDEVLAVAFATRPDDPPTTDREHRAFRLTEFAGRRLRLAFVADVNLGYLNVRLDDVSLRLGPSVETEYEVYFGDTATLGAAQRLGTTSTNRWDLPRLELSRTYFWQVVARRGDARTIGPVWQFAVPGVGTAEHFGWSTLATPQSLDAPIPVSFQARDVFDNPVTDFEGEVRLGARKDFPVVVVGEGTASGEQPLGGSVADSRTQVIYLREELGTARRLTALSLYVGTPRTLPAPRFTIRLKSTPLRAYPAQPAWERTGWTTVYQKSAPLTERGWVNFEFSSPFAYDGVNSLLVDFSFHDSDFASGGECRASATLDARAITHQSYGYSGDPLGWSGTNSPEPEISYQIPNLRLFGWNELALQPANQVQVRNGIWSGEIRLAELANGLRLTATDGAGRYGASNPFDLQAVNDVAVSGPESLRLLTLGDTLPLVYQVHNTGPAPAREVAVTDRFPTNLTLTAASASQGEVTETVGTWIARLGLLPGGATAEVRLEFLASAGVSALVTNRIEISLAEPDAYSGNNRIATLVRVGNPPVLSLDDVELAEGDSGVTNALVWVRLSEPSSRTVTVHYATGGGTASPTDDYSPVSGTLEFPPGTVARSLTIPIRGDTLDETDESFRVRLSEVEHGSLGRERGVVTLRDDDGPRITIADATVTEGNAGSTKLAFDIRLSAPSPQAVTVDYTTLDGSAVAPVDYDDTEGTLGFLPGTTNQTIQVRVYGDRTRESTERFFLRFSSPTNATLADRQATGVIANDDGLPGDLEHFVWDPVGPAHLAGEPIAVTVFARDIADLPATNFIGTARLRGEVIHPDFEVGQGSSPWPEPIVTYYEDVRSQIIYRAEELGGPRLLTGLALSITNPPGIPLKRWTIRLKTTPLRSYSVSPSWQHTGWTQVYQADEKFTTSGWHAFEFDQPFPYDGFSNLLLDLSFNNSDSTFDFFEAECRSTETAEDRAITGTSDSEDGDPLNWIGTTPFPESHSRILNLKLLSHVPVAIAPTNTTAFVEGSWTGTVTVAAPAIGMNLVAFDDETHRGLSATFDTTVANDLLLSATAEPDPVTVLQPVRYIVTVRNAGPDDATDVVVTNLLPAGTTWLSAEASAGACTFETDHVSCQLGRLPAASSAIITQVLAAPKIAGRLTNAFFALRHETEPYPANNEARATVRVNLEPKISIRDTQTQEGDDGTHSVSLDVSLSVASSRTVRVEYATESVSAEIGSDYLVARGTLEFPPGTTNAVIAVPILGDRVDEVSETFQVVLFSAVGGDILQSRATVTVTDDDGPSLSVVPITVVEGQSGTSEAVFELRLDQPSIQRISVNWATTDDSAIGGEDYEWRGGFLDWPPGFTNWLVSIPIRGDVLVEPDERFFLEITDVANATVRTNLVAATILNDDGLAGEIHHFEWAGIASPRRKGEPFAVTVFARDIAGRPASRFVETASFSAEAILPDTTLGLAELEWEYPFETSFGIARVQAIYPAASLEGARRLTSLALKVGKPPSTPLHRWTIRLKHTPLTAYGSQPVWERSGWVTVYQADLSVEEPGWSTFVFTRPFDYNGTDSLMVDFSFLSEDFAFGGSGRCFATGTPDPRAITAIDFSSLGADPLTWSSRNPTPEPEFQVPDLRFSSYRVASVQPTHSGAFIAGKWTGFVGVGLASSNLVLHAADAVGHTGPSAPFTAVAMNDADHDGLPDDWELAHGLDPHDSGDALLDPDADGANNLREYLAGTDPRVAASVLFLSTITAPTGETLLRFPTHQGRLYQLETTDALGALRWIPLLEADLAGTGSDFDHPLPSASREAGQRFYRVRLVTPPTLP